MRVKATIASLFALLGIPLVLANPLDTINATAIGNMMTTVWLIIGSVVTITPQTAPIVIKVLIFLILFTLIFWIIHSKIIENRKIAGVLAFAIAALVAWVTPNAGLIYTLISLAVPLAIILGLAGLGWAGPPFKGSAGKSLMGALLITFAWLFNCVMTANIPKWIEYGSLVDPGKVPYGGVFLPIFSLLNYVLFFMILFKLIGAALNALNATDGAAGTSAGSKIASKIGDWLSPEYWHERGQKKRQRDIERAQKENERRAALSDSAKQRPTHVREIQFQEHPSDPMQVRVWWRANLPEERILRYHVWYSLDPKPTDGARVWTKIDPRKYLSPTAKVKLETFKGRTYVHMGATTSPNLDVISGIPPRGMPIHFRVAAENANGMGPSGFSEYAPIEKTPSPLTNVEKTSDELRAIIERIRGVNRNHLDIAIGRLRALNILDPAPHMTFTAPARFPAIRPGHREWNEALTAINSSRNAVRELSSIIHDLHSIHNAQTALIRSSPGLTGLYLTATKDLRTARNTSAIVIAGIIRATGVRP